MVRQKLCCIVRTFPEYQLQGVRSVSVTLKLFIFKNEEQNLKFAAFIFIGSRNEMGQFLVFQYTVYDKHIDEAVMRCPRIDCQYFPPLSKSNGKASFVEYYHLKRLVPDSMNISA